MQEEARESPSSAGKSRGGLKAVFLCALACLIGIVGPAELNAAQERYDYDALGRLIRVIDEQGRVTEYVYDAAGNILQVITGATAQAPAIASSSPATIRRGETRQVTITGTNFTGVTVSVADPGLDISGVQSTTSQISFSLAAALTAVLGSQQISLRNAAGTATASIAINPVLPTVFVDPTPLAIPPDNVARPITIRLSNADTIDHVLSLSMSNAKATIAPASLTILAGQTQASATIRGVSAGQSTLTITSATLGTTLFSVFITGEFAGISTSFAPPLGVILQSNAPAAQTTITPIASKLLGVVVGSFIREVAPKNFTVGTGPTTLTISGVGLQTAQSVSVVPATGIALGAVTVAPDGSSVSVPLTVAANAPISQRKVVVTGSAGAFPPAAPDADRINVVRTPPQIDSIDPIFSTPGKLVTLTIRGNTFQDAQSVALVPSTGITVGTGPVASTDGTVLTAIVSIAANAPVGPRTVIVTTPGGSSDATPVAANTFSVVNQAVQTVTPVTSSPLGVVLQDANPPPTAAPTTLFTSIVGVTVGSVVTSISPTVGIIGQTTTLTLQGNQLQNVNAIQIVPSTGVTVGLISVPTDGLSVSVPMAIDINAPQTLRTIEVFSGISPVPFASPDIALFRVSAPAAAFDSMTPIVLQVGQPAVTLTIRGRNFQNASSVTIVPPEGVIINNPPTVSPDGTLLTVSISAAATAATGPRAIVVTTPGGSSSASLTAQNTLTLSSTAGTNVSPVTSPPLGVVLQSNAPPPTIDIGPFVSPALGVVLQDPNPPAAPTQTLFGANVGVTVGPVATRIAPIGFAPNTTGTLTIQGLTLNGTTAVTVNPSTGVTLGTLTVAPDGTQVSVPITIATGAPATVREVRLQNASGRVPFADPAASRFTIGVGVPLFDSITPIVAVEGTTFTMTIRGSNFTGATAVTATPPDGIAISNTFAVNATGTQLDVQMAIAVDAPVGSRVIQVLVSGAASSATASPANTLNVVTP